MKQRRLTEEQKKYILNNYPFQYSKDIADHLGFNVSTVYNFAHRMDLNKDAKFRSGELKKQGDRLREIGKVGRFAKGRKPHNYGKKMDAETYEKVKATMFKKGSKPPNWKPDGSERVDVEGYTMIKVNGKFIQKHVYLCNQKHGEVPKGYVVIFKDNNNKNLTIENLELVSRKDLMLRNTIQRYDPELQFTMKVLSKLKKQIDAKK